MVRELGHVPSQPEYIKLGKYSQTPLLTRFGVWSSVPPAIKMVMKQEGWDKRVIPFPCPPASLVPSLPACYRAAMAGGRASGLVMSASTSPCSPRRNATPLAPSLPLPTAVVTLPVPPKLPSRVPLGL